MFYSIPLSVWQEIVFYANKLVNNKQTHFLQQNFSATITPIDKKCEIWLIFELILLFVDLAQIWQAMPWEDVIFMPS